MLLSVSVIGALLKGFFLLNNPRKTRRGVGKLTALVTIKRLGTGERRKQRIDSALVRTSLQTTINTVYISPDERD
jgi:hypothetical protein